MVHGYHRALNADGNLAVLDAQGERIQEEAAM
jgi:hypothetical protein